MFKISTFPGAHFAIFVRFGDRNVEIKGGISHVSNVTVVLSIANFFIAQANSFYRTCELVFFTRMTFFEFTNFLAFIEFIRTVSLPVAQSRTVDALIRSRRIMTSLKFFQNFKFLTVIFGLLITSKSHITFE